MTNEEKEALYLRGYKAGYNRAIDDIEQNHRASMKDLRFTILFLLQKLFGFFLLLGTVIFVCLSGGDATAALITFPLGFYAMLTKHNYFGEIAQGDNKK